MGFHEKESDIYVGWYDDDQSQDFGIFYSNGGEDRYLGEWHEGCFNGWGIQYTSDSKYIGQFKMDKRSGQGILIDANHLNDIKLTKWKNDNIQIE